MSVSLHSVSKEKKIRSTTLAIFISAAASWIFGGEVGEGKEEKKKKMCCWDSSFCHMIILNLSTQRYLHTYHTPIMMGTSSHWSHPPRSHKSEPCHHSYPLTNTYCPKFRFTPFTSSMLSTYSSALFHHKRVKRTYVWQSSMEGPSPRGGSWAPPSQAATPFPSYWQAEAVRA